MVITPGAVDGLSAEPVKDATEGIAAGAELARLKVFRVAEW